MFINPLHIKNMLEAVYRTEDDEENLAYASDAEADGYATDNYAEDNDGEDDFGEVRMHEDFGKGERDDEPGEQEERKTSAKDNLTLSLDEDARKVFETVQAKILPVLGHFSRDPGLDDRAKDILAEIYSYIDTDQPDGLAAQTMVYLAEKLGIACRDAGLEPYGTPGEAILDEADMAGIYYCTASRKLYRMAGRNGQKQVAPPNSDEMAKLAVRISNTVAGRGDRDTPSMPVPSEEAYRAGNGGAAIPDGFKVASLYTYLSKSGRNVRRKRSGGEARDTERPYSPGNGGMARYLGGTYPTGVNGRVCFGVYPLFKQLCNQFSGNRRSVSAVAKLDTPENLACEVMYKGSAGFKAEFPDVRFRAIGTINDPSFASVDSESNYLVCGKLFIEWFTRSVLQPAKPDDPRAPVKCGIFKDGKTRLRGEALERFVKAFSTDSGESGVTREGVSVRIPYDRVKEYVEGNYTYSTGGEMNPLFAFFYISGTEVSTNDAPAGFDGDVTAMDERVDTVDRFGMMDELVSSGNVSNEATEEKIIEKLCTSPALRANIRKVTGMEVDGSSHKKLWDALGAYLTRLSGWMSECGSRSTAVAEDGKKPEIHVEDAEDVSGEKSLGKAWNRVFRRAKERWAPEGNPVPDAPEGFIRIYSLNKGPLWDFISTVARWFESYSTERMFDVDSLASALYASPEYFTDVLTMITPDIDIRKLFGDYIIPGKDSILEEGIPGMEAGGNPVDARSVSALLAMYLRRLDRSGEIGLFDVGARGGLALDPKVFGKVVSHVYETFFEDEELAKEWATAETCPDVMKPHEWFLLKFLLSGIESPDSARMVPPGKTDDPLVDMKPASLYRWVTQVYIPKARLTDAANLLGSLLYVAAELSGKEQFDNRKDIFQKDTDNEATGALNESVSLPDIGTVFGKYGNVLLAVAGHFCGDDGKSLRVLLDFINRGEIARDEAEARPVAEAVEKLRDVEFVVFKNLPM